MQITSTEKNEHNGKNNDNEYEKKTTTDDEYKNTQR